VCCSDSMGKEWLWPFPQSLLWVLIMAEKSFIYLATLMFFIYTQASHPSGVWIIRYLLVFYSFVSSMVLNNGVIRFSVFITSQVVPGYDFGYIQNPIGESKAKQCFFKQIQYWRQSLYNLRILGLARLGLRKHIKI